MTLIRRIKRKWTHLGVTVSTAAGIVLIARFMYIPYNGDNDVEGHFMGFRWLSSFLYSFGIEVAFILVGIIINFSTRFMERTAKRPFQFFGWAVQFVGFFFMFWIFLDESVFTDNVEMAFSIVAAIASIGIVVQFGNYFNNKHLRLVNIIRGLFSFIYTETEEKGYVKENLKDE